MICNITLCMSFNLDIYQMQIKYHICVFCVENLGETAKDAMPHEKRIKRTYGQRSLTQNNIVSEGLSFKNVSAAGLKETN